MEIERKFLVRSAPQSASVGEAIEQGYIALDGDVEVRVRRREKRSATLTIKAGSGRSRLEQELELDAASFEVLWPLTEGRRVRKLRALIGEIELDVYQGELAGLQVAEIEFSSAAAADAYQPPDWFAEELTDDARYSNRQLACNGLPDPATRSDTA